MLPDIRQQLSGSNIFVTGGAGFLGIALIEKLLRTVPQLVNIYILLRPKRGKSIQERLDEMKENSVFDALKSQGDEASALLNKLVAVNGNIDVQDLGISEEATEELVRNVDYVFHCAASLDFEADFKSTVVTNLIGTQHVIELCKKLSNLKALVYVSSVYANANRSRAEEVLYDPPEDISKVMDYVNTFTDSDLEQIAPKIIKDHPNPYTFTKNLAEHEVARVYQQVPNCIVRPSMILGAWKEPIAGWTISKNGPQGFIMGAAYGVVRRLPVGKQLIYDYIPVDTVVNTLIAAAVYTHHNRNELTSTPIFHSCSSSYNPFRWLDVEKLVNDLLHKYPIKSAVLYPTLKLLPSVTRYRLSALFYHMIPAYLLDTLDKLCGARPRLVKLHTNINNSLDKLEPFIFQEWHFDNIRCLELHGQLSPADKEVYGLDIKALDWLDFFDNMALGVRRYLIKDKDATLPKAKKRDRVLMISNYIVQFLVWGLLYFLVTWLSGNSVWATALFIPFVYLFFTIL